MPCSNVISGFMCRVYTNSLLLRTERWMSPRRGGTYWSFALCPIARSNEWIKSLMLVSVPVDMLIVWYPLRGNACTMADMISPT